MTRPFPDDPAARAGGVPEPVPSVSATTTYRRAEVEGLGIFYREAGPKDAPTIVLLHGYPSPMAWWCDMAASPPPRGRCTPASQP